MMKSSTHNLDFSVNLLFISHVHVDCAWNMLFLYVCLQEAHAFESFSVKRESEFFYMGVLHNQRSG